MTFLAFLLSWDIVTRDCAGGLEMQPVRYQVAYSLLFMRHSPVCPLDEDGNQQACLGRTTAMPVLDELSLELPEPGLGEATTWEEPVTIGVAGDRSDEPCN